MKNYSGHGLDGFKAEVTLTRALALLACGLGLLTFQASAASFTFSTGNPDGKVGTLSRPAGGGAIQTETADDFVVTQAIVITQATFTGLFPVLGRLDSLEQVEIEIYHV